MIKKNLGSAVRQIRESRELSLRALAERSGFSAAFLSQIENGQVSPSISSLGRIAQALGVSIGDFFRSPNESGSVVVKADQRLQLHSAWSRASIEVLGHIRQGRKIEGIVVTLDPDGASGSAPQLQPTEQIAFVVQGNLELTLAGQQHLLAPGDAVTILPAVPHRWYNNSGKTAQVLIVSAC